MKNFNIYKFISRAVMVAFIMLSTIQTLLDINITFGIALNPSVFALSLLVSIIPIACLLILFNVTNSKTKYIRLFVVPEIKFIIKMLLYLSVLTVFTLWSVLLVSVIGFYFQNTITYHMYSLFILEKVAYSVIYSTIVVMFFNGLSNLNIKKRDKSEL